jgi:hypothetical protein
MILIRILKRRVLVKERSSLQGQLSHPENLLTALNTLGPRTPCNVMVPEIKIR